jgi:hypothetical protein
MVREPERIDRITEKLRELWHKHPDLRLGQLLEAFVFEHHSNNFGAITHKCIFYVEDDVPEANIDRKLKES